LAAMNTKTKNEVREHSPRKRRKRNNLC